MKRTANAKSSAYIHVGLSDTLCEKIENGEFKLESQEEKDLVEAVFEEVCGYFDGVEDPELDEEGYIDGDDIYLSVTGTIVIEEESYPATRWEPGECDVTPLGSFDISEEEFVKIKENIEKSYPQYANYLSGKGSVNESEEYNYDSDNYIDDGPDPDRDYNDRY